jgi:hypothetical protein
MEYTSAVRRQAQLDRESCVEPQQSITSSRICTIFWGCAAKIGLSRLRRNGSPYGRPSWKRSDDLHTCDAAAGDRESSGCRNPSSSSSSSIQGFSSRTRDDDEDDLVHSRCNYGSTEDPIKKRSHSRAAARPSLMAQTTRLWPRRMSPAAKTPLRLVANLP